MRRSDCYIFGLAVLNVFVFIKFTSLIVASTIASVIQHVDFYGYIIFAVFLIGIATVFNNMSQLIQLIPEEENSAVYVIIKRVSTYTIILLGAFATLSFLDAYLMYNLFGG